MFAKYFVPALAIAGSVLAATDVCKQDNTVASQSDASLLESCETVEGDITFDASAAGDIILNGIQQIKGSLIIKDAVNLTTLSAPSLGAITTTFGLSGLSILNTLSFPALTSVGSIQWQALPGLTQLSFTAGVSTASDVLISDTFLTSLDGINLAEVGTFNINNNRFLKQISTQVGNITKSLDINSNGQDLTVDFPNLIWAANMTFRNCSDIMMPSLAAINGSLGFYENYMASISAPNLTTVGSGLAFVANPDLTNISLPLLISVGGGFQIANNTALEQLDAFGSLKSVGGALDFSGNFSSVALPALTTVKGNFNMQSSGNIDCSVFDAANKKQVVQGKYTCKGASTNVQTDGSSSTSSSTSSSASATKSSDASPQVQAAFGLSVFGGLLAMLL